MSIEEIPLVHIREDITAEEISFLKKTFKTKYFTIHEDHFKKLKKWKDFLKDLYLEFGINNSVKSDVVVEKIGGFCIDLSHFKKSEVSKSKEFEYVIKRKNNSSYFKCNHINGYCAKDNKDVHQVKNISQFEYLKTLPHFIFGKIIAIEMYNPIKQQLKFREYLINLLNKKFNN